MPLVKYPSSFLSLEFVQLLRSVGISLERFWPLFFFYPFLCPLPFTDSNFMYFKQPTVVTQLTNTLHFYEILFLLVFILISIAASSSSQIFSFARFNLVLILYGVFFNSGIAVSISRSFIWVLSSPMSLFNFLNIWNIIIITALMSPANSNSYMSSESVSVDWSSLPVCLHTWLSLAGCQTLGVLPSGC